MSAASLLLAGTALVAVLPPRVVRAQAAPPETAPAGQPPAPVGAAGPTVPPVPDGTPEELMAYVESIQRRPQTLPGSPEEMARYMKGVVQACREAADKILAQVGPEDERHVKAALLKVGSLLRLGQMGDHQAVADLSTYAAALAQSPNPQLAKEGGRMLLVAEGQTMLSSGDLAAAPALIQKIVDLVAADPDDAQTVGLAARFVARLEQLPDGGPHTLRACEALAPLLAKSGDPQVHKLGEVFTAIARRLTLPGKPLDIRGLRLDGAPFDPATLAGKVVLVDFWATWCGPCQAELPGIRQAYEKYHDRGFEVVGISVDEDRGAIEAFVKDQGIPWPILVDLGEGGAGLARHYGIHGLPQAILVARDGTVITLDASGPRLAEELAKLFPDAG